MQQTMKQASARFVAFFAALCMVMAMVPAMAFAADATTGEINLKATTLEVTSGTNTGNLNTLLDDPTTDGGDWHYDFVAATGTSSIFTVNKHSGVVTASTVGADATGTVTIYLMAGSAPTGNNGKPCTGYTILDQETVTVSVVTSSTYGYQGNSMTMKMTSPTVTSYSGSNSTGWVNSFSSISAANDGYYYFTAVLSNGFSNYNTPALFADRNQGRVLLKNSSGTIASLTEDNDTAVQIYAVNHSTKTVQVRVLASAVTGSNVCLEFTSGFRANNANNTLGCSVDFVIA